MNERLETASAWLSEQKGKMLGVVVAVFVVIGASLALTRPGQRATNPKGTGVPDVVTTQLPPEEQGALDGAHRAYDAWSSYSTAGDPKLLADAFVKDGPQFRRLVADRLEAAASAAPTNLRMIEPKVLPSKVSGTRTVRAEVEVEQTGAEVRFYQFDMIMQRGDDKVWRAFDVAAGKAPVPSATATTTPSIPAT